MPPDTFGAIIAQTFDHYGLMGLGLVLLATLIGTTAAQLLSLRAWRADTLTISERMSEIVGKLDIQRASCPNHYEAIRGNAEQFRSLVYEMGRLVEAFHASDKERTQQIMAIMVELVRRTDAKRNPGEPG
jgi:hypothetical protein